MENNQIGEFWSASKCARIARVSDGVIRRMLRNHVLQDYGVICRKISGRWQIDSDTFCMWLMESMR